MENNYLIKTENLTKQYPIGLQKFTALEDINLTFQKGEFAGLVGPSGSGKTTLLNILGSLDSPTSGLALVMDKNVGELSHSESAHLRNEHLGFIFQTYNLLPVYTVYENVEFPLLLLKMNGRDRKDKIMQALEWVGLTSKIKSKPGQLSGGESQRVAIARAMVKQPKIVLADEPTANLDAENSHNILKMMTNLNKELQTTFLFATHDQKVIGYLRRKISLFDGKVVADEEITPEIQTDQEQ
ncbi:ABC transporter ATP-binding protein [bacterium]|nr:ABC transporter ATP-binding protein [bacterium]